MNSLKQSPAKSKILSIAKLKQISSSKSAKVFQIREIKELQTNFKKDIESPIDFQTSVFVSKTPQRCSVHNNVITLYCLNDKKPLCVTCMYQSTTHRKHKVIPLNRASNEMEQDIRSSVKIIENGISKYEELIEHSRKNLQRAEQQFPQVINKISQIYLGLHQVLIEKEKEHMNHLRSTANRVKYQYQTFIFELSRINLYVIQKIKEISERIGEEHLLFNRNLLSSLAKASSFISPSMCSYHEINYLQDMKRFKQAEDIIKNELILTRSQFKQIKYTADLIQKSSKKKDISNKPEKSIDQYSQYKKRGQVSKQKKTNQSSERPLKFELLVKTEQKKQKSQLKHDISSPSLQKNRSPSKKINHKLIEHQRSQKKKLNGSERQSKGELQKKTNRK